MSYKIYLRHPFTMLIAGPTGSGKTEFVRKLIIKRETICDPAPERIIYYYSEYQEIFDSMLNVEFVKGLPDEIKLDKRPTWIIFDDLMYEASNSKLIAELFTKGSHHRNLSIILICQNFFMRGAESRNISLNSQYIVLFKNPRDQSIATSLARQMFPTKIVKFQKVYEHATSQAFSYLFIDLKPETPNEVRLLTNVFSIPIFAYQLV
uniref:AAA+ ATPase domain-containing protein n=1 Tax=Tetranychus urticae TaxID=32264 RepID=A0A158P4C4_TETUR